MHLMTSVKCIYDHPHPDVLHVKRAYREFILSTKRKLMQGRKPILITIKSKGEIREIAKIPNKAHRAHLHYLGYVRTYKGASLELSKRS